jgi:hypothetical protein
MLGRGFVRHDYHSAGTDLLRRLALEASRRTNDPEGAVDKSSRKMWILAEGSAVVICSCPTREWAISRSGKQLRLPSIAIP